MNRHQVLLFFVNNATASVPMLMHEFGTPYGETRATVASLQNGKMIEPCGGINFRLSEYGKSCIYKRDSDGDKTQKAAIDVIDADKKSETKSDESPRLSPLQARFEALKRRAEAERAEKRDNIIVADDLNHDSDTDDMRKKREELMERLNQKLEDNDDDNNDDDDDDYYFDYDDDDDDDDDEEEEDIDGEFFADTEQMRERRKKIMDRLHRLADEKFGDQADKTDVADEKPDDKGDKTDVADEKPDDKGDKTDVADEKPHDKADKSDGDTGHCDEPAETADRLDPDVLEYQKERAKFREELKGFVDSLLGKNDSGSDEITIVDEDYDEDDTETVDDDDTIKIDDEGMTVDEFFDDDDIDEDIIRQLLESRDDDDDDDDDDGDGD